MRSIYLSFFFFFFSTLSSVTEEDKINYFDIFERYRFLELAFFSSWFIFSGQKFYWDLFVNRIETIGRRLFFKILRVDTKICISCFFIARGFSTRDKSWRRRRSTWFPRIQIKFNTSERTQTRSFDLFSFSFFSLSLSLFFNQTNIFLRVFFSQQWIPNQIINELSLKSNSESGLIKHLRFNILRGK